MEVKRIYPSGYCKGVAAALQKVKQAVKDYPDRKIYVLGMIVHNSYIVQAFEKMGVITLQSKTRSKKELLDEIDEGVIIFTAHGAAQSLKDEAERKGLIVVDATCDDVRKNEDLIREYLSNDYDIIYIGVRNHPEAEAVLSISDRIHLVSNTDDLSSLVIDNRHILLTNQTTMSILETGKLIEQIKEKYPDITVEKEICNATYARQSAVNSETEADTLVVVGDPVSNNTNQLCKMAGSNIRYIYKVQNSEELLNCDFSDSEKIAVTAGASTPGYLINQVIGYLQNKEEKYLHTDIDQIL